ncbi:probable NADH dehydrogenase [ubiquinone] iron-sulfur protein 6, mitochondrial [Coccinella septempunctata]|uniref:probable NADH dehydrogenase [ubiquinone] iron-sulfur protein 6, mitochondrial n=1 Tax=Coccinella septempunctata TaxID=41139 RepID=UPI001D06C945|nr:probable NADH dehydrogenase [ubiquinone] iron-sulfur protein 6, mitochondrial [Coccinella septempunctata]
MNNSLTNLIRSSRTISRILVSKYSSLSEDQVTHTGQKWDKDDYRMVRFINSPKQVNPNIAMKLIAEVPPKKVQSRVVSCDGGGGPTGHPQVFINLDKPGNHSCGYCGLRFELEHDH